MITSFRDPNGKTCVTADRVFRLINPEGVRDLQSFLSSPAAAQFCRSNQVARVSFLEGAAKEQALLNSTVHSIYLENEYASIAEHERIPFPSFPHEWPPDVLCRRHVNAGSCGRSC